jgi:hypothetical protein
VERHKTFVGFAAFLLSSRVFIAGTKSVKHCSARPHGRNHPETRKPPGRGGAGKQNYDMEISVIHEDLGPTVTSEGNPRIACTLLDLLKLGYYGYIFVASFRFH